MSKKVGTNGTTGGNTITPVVVKEKKCRQWFFTWNNPDISGEMLAQNLNICDQYTFQLERGASGNEHFQGVMKFLNARSFNTVKDLLPKAHFEPCRRWEDAVKYCSKSETRILGPWTKNTRIRSLPRVISELRNWQKNFLNIVMNDDSDRHIHWVVDIVGNVGKTALAKYLCVKHNAIYLTGKSADVKYAITEHLEKNDVNLIIFDFARSQENFVSYQAIEEVKNGIFFNTKYESKMVMFDSPKIIIFANFEPDLHALSRDRWRTYSIRDDDIYEDTKTNDYDFIVDNS